MKASILILTVLGMTAINVVTGGLIEDPQQEGHISANISDVNVHSRRKQEGKIYFEIRRYHNIYML